MTSTSTTTALLALARSQLRDATSLIRAREARREDAERELATKSATLARLTHAAALRDPAAPIAVRMRAVFHLRTEAADESVRALVPALMDKRHGTLLRHEVAFCFGQMGRPLVAVPALRRVLSDDADDAIVRHEAAEALAALADVDSVPLLRRFAEDAATPPEVRETCDLALERLQRGGSDITASQGFESVDPTPAHEAAAALSVGALRAALVDPRAPLYARYKAMFALRNRASDDESAVLALAAALEQDATSALFRHEVAYVLGQLASPASVPALERVVRNAAEHEMVRHEAAEALGAVGDERCLALLGEFKRDARAIVAESCVVALDAADYWAGFASA